MKSQPTTADAYRLLHDGSLALAEVEAAGMRVDVDRLDWTIVKADGKIKVLTERLKVDDVWKLWRRRFGERASLGSRPQLGAVLFQEMGHKASAITRTGRAQVDEEALARIDLPFVKLFLKVEKLKKLRSTYLNGVKREVVNGFIHSVFNLHLVRSYRGSSDNPNIQNQPVRDPEMGKPIRSCFIPRDGHVLVEIDYSALEVRIAACYHKDPTMLEYIEDSSKDMHRDMAMQIYKLPQDQVTKQTRFAAKGQFVFASFYGSYYKQTAPGLWGAIEKDGLVTADGVPLKKWLRGQGIRDLEEFTEHVQEVDQDFWGRRFKVYAQWKLDWFREYQRTGGFQMLTGFRVDGVHKRNDVINYPVQGAAFHVLLWSLIRLVKWLKKHKMRSVVVGQIHDSIVADVHHDELDEYLAAAKRIMTEDVRKAWPWIIIPLETEAEVGELNWWEKEKV